MRINGSENHCRNYAIGAKWTLVVAGLFSLIVAVMSVVVVLVDGVPAGTNKLFAVVFPVGGLLLGIFSWVKAAKRHLQAALLCEIGAVVLWGTATNVWFQMMLTTASRSIRMIGIAPHQDQWDQVAFHALSVALCSAAAALAFVVAILTLNMAMSQERRTTAQLEAAGEKSTMSP